MNSLILKGRPIWIWMYLSPLIFSTLLIQYGYMAILIFISFRALNIKMKVEVKVRTMTMAWILSFTSQFIGLSFLQVAHIFIKEINLLHIYTSLASVFFHLITILISGFICFCLLKYLFRRVAIFEDSSIKMALFISFMTSPWIFLIPTSTMY